MSDQILPQIPEENPADAAKRRTCKAFIQRIIHDAVRRRKSVREFNLMLTVSCPFLLPTENERRIWNEEKREAIQKVTSDYLRQMRSEIMPESDALQDGNGDQLSLF